MEKGILTYFVGGLGNQLFQVVAAYLAAKTNNCPCYIPQSDARNNPHYNGINYTQTIFLPFGKSIPLLNDSHELQVFAGIYGYNPHEGFDLLTGYKPWSPKDVSPGTKMGSFYQYYPPIQEHEIDIRNKILIGLSPLFSRFTHLNINPQESAFLHIRRGDYLQYSEAFYTITIQYYYLCTEMIKQKLPFIKKIYVISDDMDWVKRHPFFNDPIFHIVDIKDELETLALMSLCKAGAICANSTFSWWGAFLGAHEHRMPVFVPKQWIRNSSEYPMNLFPKEWIQYEYNTSFWSDTYLLRFDMMETGIVPMTLGGLGNQMFNISAAYVTHMEHNVPLWLPRLLPDENVHNTTLQDYRQSVFKEFGFHIPFSHRDPDLTITLHKYNYGIHMKPGAFEKWSPQECSPKTVMSSYYQYYPTLKPWEHDLRSLFLKGLDQHRSALAKKYTYKTTAFLHIRRGDYLKFSDVHFVQPIEYYVTAAQRLLSSNLIVNKILVLSDDPEWAKSQEVFKMSIFECVDMPNELDALALMTLCEAGAICANSTFSWWGAFLGTYGKRNPVIIPRNWINQPCKDLFPEEWIVI